MNSTPVHAKVQRATIAWLGAAGLALTVLGGQVDMMFDAVRMRWPSF